MRIFQTLVVSTGSVVVPSVVVVASVVVVSAVVVVAAVVVVVSAFVSAFSPVSAESHPKKAPINDSPEQIPRSKHLSSSDFIAK